jgi:hypothetical protein
MRIMIAKGIRGCSTGFERSSFFAFRLDDLIIAPAYGSSLAHSHREDTMRHAGL